MGTLDKLNSVLAVVYTSVLACTNFRYARVFTLLDEEDLARVSRNLGWTSIALVAAAVLMLALRIKLDRQKR